jgi:hypothetical protein
MGSASLPAARPAATRYHAGHGAERGNSRPRKVTARGVSAGRRGNFGVTPAATRIGACRYLKQVPQPSRDRKLFLPQARAVISAFAPACGSCFNRGPGPPRCSEHHGGRTSHPPSSARRAPARCRRRCSLRLRLCASWRCPAHSARHWATSSTPASTTSGQACAMWFRSTFRSDPSRPSTYATTGGSEPAPPARSGTGARWSGRGPRTPSAGPETDRCPTGFVPATPGVAATGPLWPGAGRRPSRAAGATCGDRWLRVARDVVGEPSAGTAERRAARAAGTTVRPEWARVAGVAAHPVETGRSADAESPSGGPSWTAWRTLSDSGPPVSAAAGDPVTAVTSGTPRPGPRRLAPWRGRARRRAAAGTLPTGGRAPSSRGGAAR